MFCTPDSERSPSGLYPKIKRFSLVHRGTGKCSPLKSTRQLLLLPPPGGLDSLSSAVPAACNGHVIGFKFSLPWHGECSHHLIGFNVLVAVAQCSGQPGITRAPAPLAATTCCGAFPSRISQRRLGVSGPRPNALISKRKEVKTYEAHQPQASEA
jgi:hypothetical protein